MKIQNLSFPANGGTLFFKGNSDPFFSNVVLLLPLSGSTANLSVAAKGSNVIANTGVVASPTISKWGTGSAKFDGVSSFLEVPYTPSLEPGSQDFTAECWINPITVTPEQTLFGQNPGPASVFRIIVNAGSYLMTVNSDTQIVGSTIPSVAGVWSHVAMVRHGSVVTLWVNGQSGATLAVSGAITSQTVPFVIGKDEIGIVNLPYDGYMNDLRITMGVARYIAPFTPPTHPFPVS